LYVDFFECYYTGADFADAVTARVTCKGSLFVFERPCNTLQHTATHRITGANFANAVMDRGTYKGSSFIGAVLTNTVLSGSDFTNADLTSKCIT